MAKTTFIVLIAFMLLQAGLAATCGNNKAEKGEECDGTDLRGFTCRTLGDYSNNYNDFDGGTLSCKSDCKFNTANCYNCLCGDGKVRCNEECDDGEMNSDSRPNACRTDCLLPWCGDDVLDNGEECDDGTYGNSDKIPNACRTDCKLPTCGDGVVDYEYGEECEPSLNPDCNEDCRLCLTPKDNLRIYGNKKLCEGSYELTDKGEEGVIIVEQGAVLDCNGAYLYGPGGKELGTDTSIPQSALQNPNQNNQPANPIAGIFQTLFGFFGAGNAAPNAVSIKSGTGIVAKAGSIVMNCEVNNFRTGIKLDPTAVAISNRVCGNNYDLKTEGSTSSLGINNACDNAINRNDFGYLGCTKKCDNTNSQQTSTQQGDCPVCRQCEECECPECEECEPCDSDQAEPEEEQAQDQTQEPQQDLLKTPNLKVTGGCELLSAEKQLCRQLTCPTNKVNICKFFDIGEHSSGNKEPLCACAQAPREETSEEEELPEEEPTFKTYEGCREYYLGTGASEELTAKLCVSYSNSTIQMVSAPLKSMNLTISPIISNIK